MGVNITIDDEDLLILQQVLLEVSHAQRCGPGWYTKGESGLYQQVAMWIQRGQEAVNRTKEQNPHVFD